MCWNLQVSLATGTFSWSVAAYLMKRNVRWDRASALFLLAVSSMQFLDAILWWDTMEIDGQGSCSATNKITSIVLVPLVLRTQLVLRQSETNFRQFLTSVSILTIAILFGNAFFSGSWSPSEALYYFTNRSCSRPSVFEQRSPVWGGIPMPMFCFFIYFSLVLPPMIATGRLAETLMFCLILKTGLTYGDSWASKFCSFACVLSIWYLVYSGPDLPPHVAANRTDNEKVEKEVKNPFLKIARSYQHFCFGTAKL
mmetsp:Transcript_17395/g.25794  ORF Transcript_17395/g.25794 Transcript_17395/m.25794 type:complete len:254 (+) Transcript_17395:115-876(+)